MLVPAVTLASVRMLSTILLAESIGVKCVGFTAYAPTREFFLRTFTLRYLAYF